MLSKIAKNFWKLEAFIFQKRELWFEIKGYKWKGVDGRRGIWSGFIGELMSKSEMVKYKRKKLRDVDFLNERVYKGLVYIFD